MCSINGFTWQDEALVKRMNEVTRHRGPDGTGVFSAPGITLGHNRLAILDLSPAGAQPMKSRDGRFVISFNGEIYNYRELKAELSAYPFRSATDTEVILAAYETWGSACVKRLNGIFSFAIWDAKRQELFLARDHQGVKPLYYVHHRGRFIFSSEIKALLEHDIPRTIDARAFNLYMRMLYVPEPLTMFRGIKKFPQAHYGVVKDAKLALAHYWSVTDFTNISSRKEAIHTIRSLFTDSVRHQLISDRPVGVFLSGGLDSTAVLKTVVAITREPVKTYAVGFDVGVQREKFNADFELAGRTAAVYHTDHHPLMITPKDIGDVLPRIAWHLDEPNANPTAGAIYLLSQRAKQDVAVVLGGDGGDELFGGYERYFVSRVVRFCKTAKHLLIPLLLAIGKKEVAQKLREDKVGLFLSFLSQKEARVSSILNPSINESESTRRHFASFFEGVSLSGDFEKRFMNIDRQSWLPDESLLRTDKMTMAFGLEARVPVLDRRLIEYAYRLPTSWKIPLSALYSRMFQGKRIWKEALMPLPEHVLREKKRGWFTPMAKWLRTDLKGLASDILSPAHLNSDFFNVGEVGRMWKDHLEGRRYNLNLIWAVLMWQVWYDRFIEKF